MRDKRENQWVSLISSENNFNREVKTRMKLSNYIIQYIKNNKKTVEQVREMKAQVQARFCFEERIEDKDESIELYKTLCNNNVNKVEQEVKFKRDFVLRRVLKTRKTQSNCMKLYKLLTIIQLNKMRSKKYTQTEARICFEERVEDKNESMKQYVTVSNNNDYKVEQNEKQEEVNSSSSSSENLFWGESGRQGWKYWTVCVTVSNNNDYKVEQNEKQEVISSSSEITSCFEERVEDKDESIEQYVTVWNNNDYCFGQMRECIESKLSGKVD